MCVIGAHEGVGAGSRPPEQEGVPGGSLKVKRGCEASGGFSGFGPREVPTT